MKFKLLERIKMKNEIEELGIYNGTNNHYYGLLYYYHLLYGENQEHDLLIHYMVNKVNEEQVKDYLKMRIRCRLNICNLVEQELPQQFERLLN